MDFVRFQQFKRFTVIITESFHSPDPKTTVQCQADILSHPIIYSAVYAISGFD